MTETMYYFIVDNIKIILYLELVVIVIGLYLLELHIRK